MQHVLRLLETRDYVQVAELSQAFAVSEVTVRSDLGQLARQGLVARIRGGARALQHGQSEVGFDLRLRLEVEAKRAIARAAAEMVNEGEAVALDASTTAYYLALELCSKRELVVVTNGLLVATALADAPGITVLAHGRGPAPLGDVARRRPRYRCAAHDADQQGISRRARAQPSRAALWI